MSSHYTYIIPLLLPAFDVKLVQEAMEDRCEENPRRHQKYDAGKKRIASREYLPVRGIYDIDRPHAPEYHRGVQERVDPGETFEKMVSHYSYRKCNRSYHKCQDSTPEKAYHEYAERCQRLSFMLVSREQA